MFLQALFSKILLQARIHFMDDTWLEGYFKGNSAFKITVFEPVIFAIVFRVSILFFPFFWIFQTECCTVFADILTTRTGLFR
jgi:hypothetical protein